MQPLSGANEPDMDDAIHISGSGTVTSIEQDPPSFFIYATQYVDGGLASDEIAVHGCLDDNPRWTDPARHVPQEKGVIGFNGILQRFKPYHPPGRKPTTCIVITVKDITYIFTPEKKPGKPGDTRSAATQVKGGIRQKIKARTHTQRAYESDHSRTLSSPSTSQICLGKRKAENSEDEINNDI